MSLALDLLLLLALVAFVAGFVDAIAGGGGLLTVPALALAGLDPVAAVATNKVNGTLGVAAASLAFARKGHYAGASVAPLALAAAAGSILGALALTHVPRELVAAALPFVLVAVALYFALSPALGERDRAARVPTAAVTFALAPAIGFYDGVFGPGAGSFYMIGFVALLGYGAVKATAHTKLANFASNAASLAAYAALGQVVWSVGLAMGLAQTAGSILGARAAMKNGARLIRPLLVLVCLAMAARLGLREGGALRGLFAAFLAF